jgi:kumamolisin
MPELPEGYQRLEGSERRAAAGASLVGPADQAEALTVTITLRRMPGAPELPDEQYWADTPGSTVRRTAPAALATLRSRSTSRWRGR